MFQTHTMQPYIQIQRYIMDKPWTIRSAGRDGARKGCEDQSGRLRRLTASFGDGVEWRD
jgi:hypothetical protein